MNTMADAAGIRLPSTAPLLHFCADGRTRSRGRCGTLTSTSVAKTVDRRTRREEHLIRFCAACLTRPFHGHSAYHRPACPSTRPDGASLRRPGQRIRKRRAPRCPRCARRTGIPLYAFIRRWGADPDAARDLTQAFLDVAARASRHRARAARARPLPHVPARLGQALPAQRSRARPRGEARRRRAAAAAGLRRSGGPLSIRAGRRDNAGNAVRAALGIDRCSSG